MTVRLPLWAGPVSAFARSLDGLRAIGVLIAKLALAGITVVYVYEVVARYAFGAPTWWSAELVKYLLCVLVFTMMPQVTATRGQVAVTVVLEVLSPTARDGAERLIAGVGFLVCGAITVFAAEETARQIARNIQMMAAQPIPKWWVSSWIVFGVSLSALEFLRLALAPRAHGDDGAPLPNPEI
ncbi:MAG: TRAP transporter small permease [Thalassobaculaceae bacterium]|nr:TRAP transporter small permease [Thalassobaculaceae bacterium]